MSSEIRETWGDIADHWDDWGPPLRPSAADLALLERLAREWHHDYRGSPVRVFLCGVTPEIATMAWPFPVELLAMDHAETMVKKVWPGDVAGLRRAVVGRWEHSGQPRHSRDLVIGDGGFGFFGYPHDQRQLAVALKALLAPGGLFVYRHYAQVESPERLEDVLTDARAGAIGNFHAFKWRLAMALQPDSRQGVRLGDVWNAWNGSGIDPGALPQPGWSARAVATIRFYRDKDARLYFPTAREFRDVLEECLEDVTMTVPSYELGDRCPVFAARAR